MDTLISKCDGENVVLQGDFSEYATIASQNETQSAHWCHGQATLFTVYAWIKEDENESLVLVSDDLTHMKYSVYIFMECIRKHLGEKLPSISANVFSDGAGSQLKKKSFILELALLGTRSPPKAYMELLRHISWKRCRGWSQGNSQESSVKAC